MMTPFVHDSITSPEARVYNRIHAQTRNPVERAFGALKGRFPILKTCLAMATEAEDGVVIASCVVLHNWCMRHEANSIDYLTEITKEEAESDGNVLDDAMLDHHDDDPHFFTRDTNMTALDLGKSKRQEYVELFNSST